MKTSSLVPVFAVAVFGLSAFGIPGGPDGLATPAAYAKNDKGNNGGGRGGGNGHGGNRGQSELASHGPVDDFETGPRGHGAIARELKNMNAVNAFKNGKGPNAAPNSNVGLIGALRDAVIGNQSLVDEYGSLAEFEAARNQALNDLATLGVVETETTTLEESAAEELAAIQDEIDALQPGPTYEADLAALLDDQQAIEDAMDVATLKAADEDAAFEAASRGRSRESSFSEKALDFFDSTLGINFHGN